MNRRAVLINDTLADRHHGCRGVVQTIEKLASDNGISIVGRSPVHSDWQNDAAILSAIRAADIVLVNGEGTIVHDRPAARKLVDVADHCARLGKPAVLLNTSWFFNGKDLAESARGFAIIAARETTSASNLRAEGLDCRVVADLALHRPIESGARANRVGITDSVCAETALELDGLRRKFGGEIVNIFYGRRGVGGLRFFIRAFGGRQALADPLKFTRVFRAAQAFLCSQIGSEDEFLDLIGCLRLLITGRFHAAIYALSSLTPLLALESSTPKISATMKDAGLLEWRVATVSKIDPDLLDSASQWHGDEEDNIRDFQSDNRARQKQLFRDIAALAA